MKTSPFQVTRQRVAAALLVPVAVVAFLLATPEQRTAFLIAVCLEWAFLLMVVLPPTKVEWVREIERRHRRREQ